MIPCGGESDADSRRQTLQSAIPPGASMSLAACVLTGAFVATATGVPDRIFVNGRIWTGDRARPWATALAIRGDVLSAVGSESDVRPSAGPRTEVVDLQGRFVA